MQPTSFFVPLLAFVVFAIVHSSEGAGETGTLTHGQPCNPSASLHDDSSTRCDTSKRLSCDMKMRTCKCHHEERDFYNSLTDRCETKIGKFCSPSDTFPTICVSNSVCQKTTNFCVCEPNAEANDDGTECVKEDDDDSNSSTTLASQQSLPLQVTITILALVAGTWIF